jgi:hypothetical protein
MFSWQQPENAVTFRLKVRNEDKTLKLSQGYDTTICDTATSICTVTWTPDLWKPDSRGIMQWQVNATDAQGNKLKSGKRVLEPDFYPTFLTRYYPFNGLTIPKGAIIFNWQDDARIDQFRLKLADGDKTVFFSTGWLDRAALCDGETCSYTYDYTGVPSGEQRWRLQYRRQDVTGKPKTSWDTFVTE